MSPRNFKISVEGKEAIPIRAISFVTGGSWTPLTIARSLANPRVDDTGFDLHAYFRKVDGSIVPILPKSWDTVVDALLEIESMLASSPAVIGNSGERMLAQLGCFPAGSFVWVEDFEWTWGENRREFEESSRLSDGALTYDAIMQAALSDLVFEGFATETRAAAPLDGRARNTLLAIIGVLAKAADISITEPYKAGGIIAKLLEEEGVSIDQRTVGDHLKQVPDVIEKKKSKLQ